MLRMYQDDIVHVVFVHFVHEVSFGVACLLHSRVRARLLAVDSGSTAIMRPARGPE